MFMTALATSVNKVLVYNNRKREKGTIKSDLFFNPIYVTHY